MRIEVLTIFPGIFHAYLGESILRRAADKGAVTYGVHDLRRWTEDNHSSVDDRPYGGGPGMVLMAEPVLRAVDELTDGDPGSWRILVPSPAGRRFDQRMAEELAGRTPEAPGSAGSAAALPAGDPDPLLLIAPHYEGWDQRIADLLGAEEVSIGDFVLTGGEVPALAVVDAVVRLLPGVVGREDGVWEESFSRPTEETVSMDGDGDTRTLSAAACAGPAGGMLEYPHYTRPAEVRGVRVPEVLLGGDHAAIARWRREQALLRTLERRPDLLADRPELLAEARALAEDRRQDP